MAVAVSSDSLLNSSQKQFPTRSHTQPSVNMFAAFCNHSNCSAENDSVTRILWLLGVFFDETLCGWQYFIFTPIFLYLLSFASLFEIRGAYFDGALIAHFLSKTRYCILSSLFYDHRDVLFFCGPLALLCFLI